MKRTILFSKTLTLPGDVINQRLHDLCYWSYDNMYGLVDDDTDYTQAELSELLSSDCASSGEFDSMSEALSWGRKCAKAIFRNVDVYDL